MGRAENCGKAQGLGDGSAVGLISEHRWLLLPQVTEVAALQDHVPRRLPGGKSMAEVPGRGQTNDAAGHPGIELAG